MDDDIRSLNEAKLSGVPSLDNAIKYSVVSQLSLSLYLTTQCQIKLHHVDPVSLARTLDNIEIALQNPAVPSIKFDQDLLSLAKRKILAYFCDEVHVIN